MSWTGYILTAVLVANPPSNAKAFARLTPHMQILGVQLLRTTFHDAQRRLGRAEVVHNGGDAAASAYASCYVGRDGTTLALVSVSEMGEEGKIVTNYQLVTKGADADFSGERSTPWPRGLHPRRPHCLHTKSVSMLTQNDGGLRIGMAGRDVRRLLGEPAEQSATTMAWFARRDEPYEERTIEVKIANGVVSGIFVQAAPF